jgi:hypothetical protein
VAERPDAPRGTLILYVHGVPAASWEWEHILRRTSGFASSLPGFGESDKPEDFDYSRKGYADFLERFTGEVGLGPWASRRLAGSSRSCRHSLWSGGGGGMQKSGYDGSQVESNHPPLLRAWERLARKRRGEA